MKKRVQFKRIDDVVRGYVKEGITSYGSIVLPNGNPAVKEIITYGCQSGIVSALITYKDTEAFFDRHTDEIFELVEDAKQMDLIDINDFILCKNNLAWFAFETIAQEIYQEMEIASEF